MFMRGRPRARVPSRTTLDRKAGVRQLGQDEVEEEHRGLVYDRQVIMRMWAYIRPHWLRVVVIFVGMLTYTATVVALPKIIQVTIDDYIAEGDLTGLNLAAAGFLVVALLQMVSDFVHRRTMAFVGQRVLLSLRVDLFSHLQRLSMSFFDRNEMGKIMSRVQNDVRQLQEVLSIVVHSLADVLSLVGIVAVMLWMDPWLALLTLTVVPPLAFLLLYWQRYARRSFLRVRMAIAGVNSDLQENISGVRVVQSLNREGLNRRLFGESNHENLDANLQAALYSAVLPPSVDLLSAVALAMVVFFGGTFVLRGTLEVGVLVAFALYIQRFFDPVRSLTGQYAALQRAMVAGARIFQLLDVKPEVTEKPDAVELPPVQGEVCYEGVGFHYTPDTPVLRGIDLHIGAGETVALVGPTGAGKTSLTSLLLRLYDVTEGRITIDGHDIRDVRTDSLARQMGIVPQEPYLFSGSSIKQNIRYNREEITDEEIERAAKAVGAHEFISRLERGYETPLQERGGNLSVGQRQLISFARAIVGNPRILVLDEATASIDTQSEVMIQQALDELLHERTALIIAHRLSTIRNADRIVVIDEGRVMEQGTHAQLMASNGIYATLSSFNLVGEEVAPEGDPFTPERHGVRR